MCFFFNKIIDIKQNHLLLHWKLRRPWEALHKAQMVFYDLCQERSNALCDSFIPLSFSFGLLYDWYNWTFPNSNMLLYVGLLCLQLNYPHIFISWSTLKLYISQPFFPPKCIRHNIMLSLGESQPYKHCQ